MVLLLERSKLVVEGAGAVGVAALHGGQGPPRRRRDLRRALRRQRRRLAARRVHPSGRDCSGPAGRARDGGPRSPRRARRSPASRRRARRQRPRRRRTCARASSSTSARPRSSSCCRPTGPTTASGSSTPSAPRAFQLAWSAEGGRFAWAGASAGEVPRVQTKLDELRPRLAEVSDLGRAPRAAGLGPAHEDARGRAPRPAPSSWRRWRGFATSVWCRTSSARRWIEAAAGGRGARRTSRRREPRTGARREWEKARRVPAELTGARSPGRPRSPSTPGSEFGSARTSPAFFPTWSGTSSCGDATPSASRASTASSTPTTRCSTTSSPG